MVTSASSAREVSESVPGTAPPTLVKADVAICGLVLKRVVPASLTSTMITEPVGAVFTLRRTLLRVIACGMRKVTLAVPVVRAVVSSEQATTISALAYCHVAAVVLVAVSTCPALGGAAVETVTLLPVVVRLSVPVERLTSKAAALPVAFVRTMALGVPASPLYSTGAPAEPILTPRAVAMPVPKEVIPVPPFATGSAVPLKVIAKVPLVVTGEPVTERKAGTVAATLVTVPVPAPVAAMVIEPLPLVTLMPVPAVIVALVRVLPVLLPMSNCPSVKVVWPVPPLVTASVDERPAAVPVMLLSVSASVPLAEGKE